mmetsp:Transcript_35329/g.112413  ORF Transcript_35329/g.112413 Transcript_35329/m.112413 type:complete len:351 (+) Transcript_35329:99-1151(+)
MAMPVPMLDPDDPTFKGRTWEQIEQILEESDQYVNSIQGFDIEREEARGPTFTSPCKPMYGTFPWEEQVSPFERKPVCTAKNWTHSCLSYTVGKQTATLKFTKPTGNNTIDPTMLDALQDAITDLQDQPQVRVVILKSEGKLFSNGFDPKYLMSESNLTEQQIAAVQLQFAKVLYFLQKLPQLTIALVQGSAMGAAVGLVCACDLVYSVKGAFFAMSETKLGAVATTSIPYITRRITFIKNVYQLVLAGASLSAETAKDYGIVNEVVDDAAALEAQCKTICDKMTLCAPGAVAATKEVVMNTVGVPPSSFMLNYVASVLTEVRTGPEARSGIEAIQSKKKPVWAEVPVVP